MGYETPHEYRYTDEHEWVDPQNATVRIGITDFAQDALTDVVYVELPRVNDTFAAGEAMAIVESVKSVSDVYAPISGTVTDVNETLETSPELINDDPYGEGWMVELSLDEEPQLESLMDADAYRAYIADEA